MPNAAHTSFSLSSGVFLCGVGACFTLNKSSLLFISKQLDWTTLIAKNIEMGSLEMLSRRTMSTDMPVMAQVNILLLLYSEFVCVFLFLCEKHCSFLRAD